jgi:hypothetical protein
MIDRKRVVASAVVSFLLAFVLPLWAAERVLEVDVQTRDPKTGAPILTKKKLDPSKTGIVIIDPWNFHWCITATQRVVAMGPRLNRALECARQLGIYVMWSPTEVASMYAGTPQRERAAAVACVDVPEVRKLPSCDFTAHVGECMCGPGLVCEVNYGADGICPTFNIAKDDVIVSGRQEVYSICKHRGITHLIYMGLHTNMCVYNRTEGLSSMYATGLECMLARDINDAFTNYNPQTGYTLDDGTAQVDRDLEGVGIGTLNFVEEMKKAGVWKDEWIVDPVRLAPWGVEKRPYFFEDSVTIALTCPWLKDVQLRYTVDGSAPTATSNLYSKPFPITQTTTLRAAAYRSDREISLESTGYFVHLGPMPPKPDLYLDQIKSMQEHYPWWFSRWNPVINANFEDQGLLMRGQKYNKGVGMRAPANIRYELKPEYDRFVARAGIDGNMRNMKTDSYGLFPAEIPSAPGGPSYGEMYTQQPVVQFRIFVDGRLAAESSIMRFSQEPWRFDVKIPKGSRVIDLTATDDGIRSVLNLADWVDAGFVLRKEAEGN